MNFNNKDIYSYIKELSAKIGFMYSPEVPSAENVKLDGTSDVLWANINEDGVISSTSSTFYLKRHIQVCLFRNCNFDDDGQNWLDIKNSHLLRMLDFISGMNIYINDSSDYSYYQDSTYQCGFDKDDDNKAYVLLDMYVEDYSGQSKCE